MKPPRSARPLDFAALRALALRYVGRYATTRAKLAAYLSRKIGERGWDEGEEPPIGALVAEFAALGYVDDDAFAAMRANALTRRGFGARRIADALAGAGIDRDAARRFRHDDDAAVAAAEAFARRKRIGPFAEHAPDAAMQRRAFAAMVRAGHDFALARRFSQPDGPSPE